MQDPSRPATSELFGAVATPIQLDSSSLHRVRLVAASVAVVAFVAYSLAWDWTAGWVIAGLAAFEVGHAAYHMRRRHPVWLTLLVDIVVISLAIAIFRPPALAIITPVVYLVAAPMLLTTGRLAIRLAVFAIFVLSVASYAVFEWPATIEWTGPRTVLMVASFQFIFGPLILWMINATSRQSREREVIRRDLETARNRLEDVFRDAPMGMEITGVGPGDFLAVNPAFCEFLGYSEEELLGKSIYDVVHPEDLAESMPEAKRVVAGELHGFERERRYIHADGRLRWAHFSLSVIRDDDGRPQYAIGQIQDITRRKAAEAERDLLLELSLAVAGALSVEEAMRSVLSGLCAAGGWSVGALWVPGRGGMERVHTWAAHPSIDRWADTSAFLAEGEGLVGAVIASRKPIEVPSIAEDSRFVSKSEAADLGLDVALGIPVLAADEVPGVLLLLGGPGVELEASRTAVEAVVAQLGQALAAKLAEDDRDRMAGIVEHTTDYAGFADISGRIRYINPSGREMLGIGPDEDLSAISFDDLHPAETADFLARRVLPKVMVNGSWQGETLFRSRDGRTIPTSQVVIAHYDKSGAVSQLSTVARDITLQKQLESQQADAIRSKDEFIASVSHELRTPLTAVRGFAEILADPDHEVDEADRREMIMTVAAEAADVSDIVEDLLVAARSDIDQLTISPRRVDLGPVVRETAQRVRWGNKVFDVSLDPAAIGIADPLRLRQILRNLMVNAVRYGGDSVCVTTRVVNEAVVIEVSDNGPGIPEDAREEIFAPYRRAHSSTGLPGSVGLGLSVSRRLARLMSGDVTYTHTTEGSIFTVTLPAF